MKGHSRGALLLLTLCAVPALLLAMPLAAAAAPGPGNNNGQGNMNGLNRPPATPPPPTPAPPTNPAPTNPAPTMNPAPVQSQSPTTQMTAPPQAANPAMQAPAMQAPAMQAPAMQAPMQAPDQGAQAMGQAPTDGAAPGDQPMNTEGATQSSAPSRSPLGGAGVPMAGLGKSPLLNLFPGILAPVAILMLAAALVLGFLRRRPRRASPAPGAGRLRFQPVAVAGGGTVGQMTVTHRTPILGFNLTAGEPTKSPGLSPTVVVEPPGSPEPSLTAVEPPEPPEPPPPPSTPTLPPLDAPGTSVYLAQGRTDASDIGTTGLTAQTRAITPPPNRL